jgi:hypothetical protein
VLASLVGVMLGGLTGCAAPATREAEVGNVHFSNLDGYVELISRRRERDQQSKTDILNLKSTETIFEENLGLETEGYIYHPNFLELALAGVFGLTQRDYTETRSGVERSDSEDGDIVEFDLTGRFLKKKMYPGLVYARRSQELEPRMFAPSIETTADNYGVIWQYFSPKTPSRVQLNRNVIELVPVGGDEAPGRQENTTAAFETGYNFSEFNALTFSYTRSSISEEPYELSYDADDVALAHRLDFGDQHQHRLQSELSYYDQRGTFNIERTQWRELLRLNHTETLRSWYQLEVTDRTQGNILGLEPIDEQSYYLAGTIEHQLYDSLVSQLYAYLQRQEYASGPEIDRYGAQASFDYRKTNRWGELRSNYRAGLEQQDRRGGFQRIEVLDERRTFQDPEPVVLASANIETGSIFVTAEDRTTYYMRGRDYTVYTVGDRVELRRVPTGEIADGETVLVDYVFSLGGDLELDTVMQHFELRQDFDWGLSPYYRLRWQDQTITPATASGAIPEDITAHTFGLEYRRGSLRLGGEYEDHASTINPYEAFRLSASYNHRFKSGAAGTVRVRWSDASHHRPDERRLELFTVETRYRHPLTRRLSVEGTLLYRTGTDTLTGDDEGFDLDLALEYIIRRTELRITYEYAQYEDAFARNDSSLLYVQLKRRF